MKPTFFVFNIAKTAIDEDGLKVGPGQLTNGGSYTVTLYTERKAAENAADAFARQGTAGAIFEVVEGRVVKPQPVEILTYTNNRS